MADIVRAIEDLFISRDDVYPMQMDGLNEYKVIKEKINKDTIAKHLNGQITIGSFQINPKDNKVKWVCFDFDGHLAEELEKAKMLFNKLKERGFNPLLEFSGRRGYHVWLFIEPVDASVARKFALEISKEVKPHEVFPRQDKIEKDEFGGQVKIPIGIHRVSNQRSFFFDENFKQLSDNESRRLLIEINNQPRDVVRIKSLEDFII